MRAFKLLVTSLILAPFVLASAQPIDSCAPSTRLVDSLMIAWIDCYNHDEVVVLLNGSNTDIDLTGYWLETRRGFKFFFQNSSWNPYCCVIKSHDLLRLHSAHGNLQPFSGSRDLHWLTAYGEPSGQEIWTERGGVALLFSPEGEVVSHYEYGNGRDP
ncbi:MAG: hypothetical protein A2Z21_04480 [Candidatus Fraserbacteria bacterium RBG_16_55_9]|uniref:LTD domain-containing protein n=1 Tax=Fraserbacteria sp. (strain RBG_16_55_9) TaxID=1817864 RepID=A0A1F5UV75_FRAXR|nr:MAG: hypothetical protein A2Z21_04480 [Candidatus Fraserbacteria bacterium RBG_16_55_9]